MSSQPYTIDRILKDSDQIWVRNLTAKRGPNKSGTIHISLKHDDSYLSVMVPLGGPICLNDQVPTEALRHSADLRRLVAGGALAMLNDEEVKELPKTALTRSRKEVAKLTTSPQEEKTTFEEEEILNPHAENPPLSKPTDDLPIDQSLSGPTPRVLTIMNEFLSGETTGEEVVGELEKIQEGFTDRDVEYIVQNNNGDAQLQGYCETLSDRLT